MEVTVRELKRRLSTYLRRAACGEEVIITSRGQIVARLVAPEAAKTARVSDLEKAKTLLRDQPWIRPSTEKLRLPEYVLQLAPGEKTLAEIVIEERG